MSDIDFPSVIEKNKELVEVLGLTEIARRKRLTADRWQQLMLSSEGAWSSLDQFDREGLPGIAQRACIYVTGSMARNEATIGSDLDLFVIDKLEDSHERLTYVETAHLVSALDRIRAASDFRRFSRGGEFIITQSLASVIEETGSPIDDAKNHFTARMLLLLNSAPLLNESAYDRARASVLDRYWQENATGEPFLPIMLINDIRRWWGVLGLNFERYNPKTLVQESGLFFASPEREHANLKLRYARLLACYSTVLALVAQSSEKGLSRSDVDTILRLTPVDRMLFVREHPKHAQHSGLIDALLSAYSDYLDFMSGDTSSLEALADRAVLASKKQSAYEFHDTFVDLFHKVGQAKTLYKYAIV